MWSKLDDGLIDHVKVFSAADIIGKNGGAIAIGFFAIGLMWTNKHLTDGHLPAAVVRRWRHVEHPTRIAEALVEAGLWEKNGDGYLVHDFHDHNLLADDVLSHRAREHANKSKAGRAGGLRSAEVRKQKKQDAKQP